MNGQEFRLVFKQKRAFLTSDKSMPLEKALSQIINIEKKEFKYPAYWTIRVIDYNETEKRIFFDVLSYDIGETQFPPYQKQLSEKLNDIEIIKFRNIDTAHFYANLSGKSSRPVSPSPNFNPGVAGIFTEPYIRQPYKHTLTQTFSIPIKNVRFILGGVSFDKKLKRHSKPVSFTVTNHDIKEEFNAVKNYFANILKTKKIEVTATMNFTDYEITSTFAKSPEIEKINKDLIDNVKFELVRAITKYINTDIDKNIFTMDDCFVSLTDDKLKSDTFYDNEKDFLEDLLKISNTKHYKHLRFLSSKHLHNIMKLRFIHNPFSFIFLIPGGDNNYIIWETLDTEEATYIWRVVKDPNTIKLSMENLEEIIKKIKVEGKKAYLNTTDETFRRVNHDYSNPVDGFVKWKDELENCLI